VKAGARFAGPLIQLRTVPAFETLTSRQLATLAQGAEETVVQRGTPLLERGYPAEAMYLVVDGRVLVKNRQLLHMDVAEIMANVRDVARCIKPAARDKGKGIPR